MKYKPPFTITPVILRLVSEISELVGHVQALSGSASPSCAGKTGFEPSMPR